jgi:L-fucose isomerase-like protein
MDKLKVGFLGATQTNFGAGAAGGKGKLFEECVEQLRGFSKKMGFDLFVYPEFLITGEDAVTARKTLEEEKIDFLLLQSTTFSAGEIITNLAGINAFIGLWAIPEVSSKGSMFVESSNSFCGVNMYAGILSGYLKDQEKKYKWFYGWTDSDLFQRRLEVTVKALTAIKKLRNSRVALIGGIAPGFDDLYFDERAGRKRLGIDIQRNHEFSEIKQRALSYREPEIEPIIGSLTCRCRCTADVVGGNLDTHARFYKAYEDVCREYGYDALGISCWPKMQAELGCLSCSIIGMLNQNGIPAACEGDLPGAVSMLMQKYIAEVPTTLMDLSDLDETDQTVLMWHCGPSPEWYSGDEGVSLTYSVQPTDAVNVKKIGLINDMTFKPRHVTFSRITGEWDSLLVLDGSIIDRPKESPVGSRGWVGELRLNRRNIAVRDLMNTILVQGIPHHYPMIAGDITEELLEAAAWLDLKPVSCTGYENYLQNKVV